MMRRDLRITSRIGARFGTALLLAGCSASATHSPGAPGGSDAGGSNGGSVATASIGPIAVAAGEEKTVCIVKRLDNTEDIVATSFVSDLAPGSHHLIVYRSSATAEQLTPVACNPFEGVLGGDVPLVIVTRGHLEYTMPSGVGVELGKGQLLKIEAHYINTTSAPLQGNGAVEVKGTPLAQAGNFQAADVGLWGTTNINVPARSTFSTPVNFQTGISGTKLFALTTHEHHLGTDAQVWSSASAGDVAHQLSNDTDWANPTLVTLNEPLAFDGTNGLSYQCKWDNTTDTAVTFGESALNEMCFAIFYYYPSHGTDICLDGKCKLAR
jgi:hypothetical protein